MKELSIEEKAKAYEELLVKLQEAKVDNNVCDERYCCVIDDIVPELKESEDEKIRKSLIDFHKSTMDINGIKGGEILAWLEKQGEQKSTDKLEPKFKVGDWVVYNRNDNSREIMQIYDIKDGRYYFTDNVHFSLSIKECDEKSHFWSIEDAKDGDVLCCENGWTCIFKALGNHTNTFSSYCFMDKDKWFCNTGSECHTVDKAFFKTYNGEIHPATKEQRDTLMKAMTDAGYTFDFDKKELRKLKFGVGDIVKSKSQPMLDARKIISIDKDCYWCEDRGCIGFDCEDDCELVEQSSAWSEEDERTYKSITYSFAHNYPLTVQQQEFVKSLKERYTWKPSDEQMKALKEAVDEHFDVDGGALWYLYNDLEKLRG